MNLEKTGPCEKHPIAAFIENYLQMEGSLWMPEELLYSKATKHKIDLRNLEMLCEKGAVKKLTMDGVNYYTVPSFHKMETQAAYNCMRILYADILPKVPRSTIFKIISDIEKEIGITLHSQQREAVVTMVNNGFCVITGGPGTGKTCTLNTAVKVLEKVFPGIDIRFTAPTGKAAHRITESVKRSALTIHRELHITRDKKDPDYFTGDVLVIDEVSMLDIETANAVFGAIRDGQRVILVGDIEQLPSVGPGAILRDLINSCAIPCTMLTKTFRQAEDSALFANILNSKNGNPNLSQDDEEFVIHQIDGGEKTVKQLVDIFEEEVKKTGIDNTVCLVPYRKAGNICSNKLNNAIQERINPRTIGKKSLRASLENGQPVTYIVGDPVMQLENRDECANGDVGKVIDVEGDRLVVKYTGPQGDDFIVRYWKSELKTQLSLAYAMSINKSQGSEYKTVIICMTEEHRAMLTRNMLYTGITRAKKRVVLIEEHSAIVKAMKNVAMYANEISNGRTTMLAEKLMFYKDTFEKAAAKQSA